MFEAGKPIAGLNISMGELLDLLYPRTEALLRPDGLPWKRGEPAFWGPDRLYYSIIVGGPYACGTIATTNEYDRGFEHAFADELPDHTACSPKGT